MIAERTATEGGSPFSRLAYPYPARQMQMREKAQKSAQKTLPERRFLRITRRQRFSFGRKSIQR